MWDNFSLERLLWAEGFLLLAGIDEVGRGALAGPVFSAAVILRPKAQIPGITDSKALTPLQRSLLAKQIKEKARAFALGISDHAEVDRVNVLQATIGSMTRAVQALSLSPDVLLIDALYLPQVALPQIKITKGDYLSASVGAASIVAKVARDEWMVRCSPSYPQYGFHSNKGYGSRQHLEALDRYGPCELHRKTFHGVKETLKKGV
ncbi:MAG: ribonuclease HII [Acidobacteria bacterium]|nr:ribonuclease HII [Acidobacteriota bacterium]MBI3658393.1 ribonuclease HII [Acidobacteriota bacterium]